MLSLWHEPDMPNCLAMHSLTENHKSRSRFLGVTGPNCTSLIHLVQLGSHVLVGDWNSCNFKVKGKKKCLVLGRKSHIKLSLQRLSTGGKIKRKKEKLQLLKHFHWIFTSHHPPCVSAGSTCEASMLTLRKWIIYCSFKLRRDGLRCQGKAKSMSTTK